MTIQIQTQPIKQTFDETGHNEIISIIGRKGQGKTVLTKSLINAYNGHVFIYDFLHSYAGKEFFSLKDLINDINDNHYIHIYRGNDKELFFNSIYTVAIYLKNCFVVLDEIHVWYDRKQHSVLTTFFRIARHRNISIVSVSQRFSDMPPVIRALTDIYYLFLITEPSDIYYISKYVSDVSTRLPVLQPFHYLKIKIS